MKTLKNSFLALALSALSLGVAACDGTEGDPVAGNEAIQTAPTSPARGVEPSADVTPFLGAWTYSSGSATTLCGPDGGKTDQISAVNGSLRITAGTVPNQIVVDDSGCIVSASVSGTEAVAIPGTRCPGNLGTVSFVYTVSGGSLRKQMSALVTLRNVTCGNTEDATLVRE